MDSCPIRSNLSIFFAFLLFFLTGYTALAQDQADIATKGVIPAATEGAAAAAASADGIPEDPAIVEAGEALFKNNCTVCHAVTAEVVVGPGLQGIHERRPLPWIIEFVKNSQRVIQSGDPYAVELYNKFNKTQMPSFAFSNDEIVSIVAYLKNQSVQGATSGPVGAEAAPDGQTGAGPTAAGGENINRYLDIVLIVLVVVLIAMVITLLLIASILRAYLKQNRALDPEDAEDLDRRFDFSKIYKSRAVQVIAGLIFLVVIVKVSLDAVMDIGIQQGYAPKQPIVFSHALHAGEHAIDCNYCHTSVYKSASANIPSANICMNCHSQIATQSPEVQKIYRAIERNQPIEWVRVHNLPDLAYFNHAQHTQVGGVQCQTCHGPIQEMEVVTQWAPLTMGWCINCHRETPLNTEGNGYYDKLVQIHDAAGKGKAMTVASNGGTECSKCHY